MPFQQNTPNAFPNFPFSAFQFPAFGCDECDEPNKARCTEIEPVFKINFPLDANDANGVKWIKASSSLSMLDVASKATP